MLQKPLLGFSDFFDEVGAIKAPAAKPAGKKTPGKGPKSVKPYPTPAQTSGIKIHKKALKGGHSAIVKAGQSIARAQLALSKKPITKLPVANVKTTGAKPAAAVNLARITGKNVVLGATVAAKMSPRAMRAVQIHNDAVLKAKKAGQVLAQHAIKTKKSVEKLAKHMINQKKALKQLRTPKRAGAQVGYLLADPVVGPQVAEMLGAYYESVGADPDPANPGFLTDGSPDPAAAATDPSADSSLAVDTTDTTDAPDGSIALPDASQFPPDVIIPDLKLLGGIAYDGSKGTPNGYVGSYGIMTKKTDDYHTVGGVLHDGTSHYGVVWGSFDREGVPNGIMFGGQGKENAWNHFHGREEGPGTSGWHNVIEPSEAFSSAAKESTNKTPYGPLIGNPGMKDFAAMRVDSNGFMGWLPQEAPDWVMFPIKQAAALTAQAAAKAAADAAKADAAAAAKTAADDAAALAAQNAANALAESQAASEAKVAQGQEETKQAQAETEAQQSLVQQQAADTAAQQVETDQTKQAGDLMIQQAQQQAAQDKQVADMLVAQAQQEQAYYAAHPDENPAAAMDGATDDSDGGGDSGGDLTDEDAADFNEGNEDVAIDYSADA